jgi:streptomycin 6-kinase
MIYKFTEKQKKAIIKNWGDDFYGKILRDIETYSEKWKLSDFELVEYYSINAILFCKSELYGDCVLKIGGNYQDYEFAAEYNTLRAYNGRKYVKVYESDIDIANGKKIMLIERAIPGNRLREEKTKKKRLAVFSELFNGLHIEPENPEIYTSYKNWIYEAVKDCEESQNDIKEIGGYMQKAQDIYLEIIKTYDKNMLLHIDIYGANIVSESSGGYKIIDPKGVIGDPIFETGQYIFAECCEDKIEPENIEILFNYFEKSLNIPQNILRKCFFIETVRFISYYASKYGASEFDIERVKFAWNVVNNNTRIL